MLMSSKTPISLRLSCLFVLVVGKPHSTGSSERIQLSGTYSVRKGRMHLPVNRWARRQVILCGTCLIVSSVKDSVAGKMHVLPLIGGKVSRKQAKQSRLSRLLRSFALSRPCSEGRTVFTHHSSRASVRGHFGWWSFGIHHCHWLTRGLLTLASLVCVSWGFPGGSDRKGSAGSAGDPGSVPGSGRAPGEGNDYPLQYSCLENSVDRGAWRAAVHGLTELDTLSD